VRGCRNLGGLGNVSLWLVRRCTVMGGDDKGDNEEDIGTQPVRIRRNGEECG
jgi:hypothetical protein